MSQLPRIMRRVALVNPRNSVGAYGTFDDASEPVAITSEKRKSLKLVVGEISPVEEQTESSEERVEVDGAATALLEPVEALLDTAYHWWPMGREAMLGSVLSEGRTRGGSWCLVGAKPTKPEYKISGNLSVFSASGVNIRNC